LLLSHCIVLVHPLEARQSTRSLPFVELCLDATSLSIEIGRRFADDSLARQRMADSADVWLMYPDDANATSIQDAWQQRRSDNVTVVFLDATWQVRRLVAVVVVVVEEPVDVSLTHRLVCYFPPSLVNPLHRQYAKEMHRHNKDMGLYPAHTVCVKLTNPERPRRFEIRTPLSDDHWCTAEAIAHTLAEIEQRRDIFETIMKPLDLVVERWHAIVSAKKVLQQKDREEQDSSIGNGAVPKNP
jgi:DTW domain-containing protein YfiP